MTKRVEVNVRIDKYELCDEGCDEGVVEDIVHFCCTVESLQIVEGYWV